jgi:hypothetical protein
MDSKSEKPTAKAHVRVLLTDEELQLPSIDDLCNKYFDWLKISKESAGGRKTRAANRRADAIFDEIMAFKLPPVTMIQPQALPTSTVALHENGNNSTKNSIGGDSDGSSVASSGTHTTGRILRPRCRTPSVSRKQEASPCTPTHQSIRANMKKTLDSANSANVLSAALNQQHPSVSVTKIRQLLRADSAQKKREEEKERQERVRLERKAKEERAEAQKKQLLEERAVTAKMKREQRLLHAAEVRKAREKAKIEQKLREGIPNISRIEPEKVPKQQQPQQQLQQPQQNQQHQQQHDEPTVKPCKKDEAPQKKVDEYQTKTQKVEDANKKPVEEPPAKPRKLDETFQKPAEEQDNIEITEHDETNEEPTKKVDAVAAWARAPKLRDLIVAQFKKLEEEIIKEAFEIFGGVELPVDLEQIFASHKISNKKYLARTSSAVWTPPHKPLKRTSSQVFTPTDQKR